MKLPLHWHNTENSILDADNYEICSYELNEAFEELIHWLQLCAMPRGKHWALDSNFQYSLEAIIIKYKT